MPYALIINGNQITITEGNYPQLSIGLDSEKLSSPSIGNMHIATDTGKNYICFAQGYWSLSSSPIKIKYDNHLGTTDNIMSVIVTLTGSGTTDTTNHLMVLTTSMGTFTGSACYKMNVPVFPALETAEINFKVTGIANGSGGSSKLTVIGLCVSETEMAGLNFQCDNVGQWTANITDAFDTYQSNISAIVDGDILTIKTTSFQTVFYVNGSVVYSRATGFAAADDLFPLAIVSGVLVTTARTLSVDYIGYEGMK